MYCYPIDTLFNATLSHGPILGAPLIPADIDMARFIQGPCPQCISGKSANPSYQSSPTMPERIWFTCVHGSYTTSGHRSRR
jgi:hypothetical protein